jgi:hypothetical protein
MVNGKLNGNEEKRGRRSGLGRTAAQEGLLGDKEGQDTKTFRQSHGDDAKGQDATESAGVATHGFHCFGADEAHADGSTCASDGLGDVASDAGGSCSSCVSSHSDDFCDHVVLFGLWCHPPPHVAHGLAGKGCLVMPLLTLLMTMVVMSGGELDINGAQQGENDGLEQAD